MITLMTWLDRHPVTTRWLAMAFFLLACALEELPGVPTTW